MKNILLLIMLTCQAHAGSNIVTTPTGLTFVNDGIWTKVDQSTTQILAAIKAIPACSGTPVVTPPVVVIPPVVTPGIDTGVYVIHGGGAPVMKNSLTDAAGSYASGDTVHITKSLDNQSGAFTTGDVNIVCDPGVKLTWSGGTSLRPAWGKGFFVFEGTTVSASVKGCEMSGMVLAGPSGGNAAAIRGSQPFQNLTVDSIYAHDNNLGILGGGYNKTIITNSKFEHNGIMMAGATANVHNIYIDGINELDVTGSYFGPVTPANLLKSRAKVNVITGNTFVTDPAINSSYLIDLPNGGLSTVKGNVLVKAANQAQRYLLSYGVEGYTGDGRTNQYEFSNNVIVSDMPNSTAFLNLASGGLTNFHDDTLIGLFDQVPPITNMKTFADRASAGLGATQVPALPAQTMSVMSVKPKKVMKKK